MPLVTGVKMSKDKTRARLYLDGKYAFTISLEAIRENNLETGIEIDQHRVDKLKKEHQQLSCFNSACVLLGYRPRSENELRQRLIQKGFDSESVENTIQKLKEKRLIDDISFSKFWADNRDNFKPQSAGLTRWELKKKGISEQVIEEVLEDQDDFSAACRAARSRAMRMTGLDRETFRRRLGGFLERRGFKYGVIKPTIEKMWRELNQNCE